MSNDHDCGHTDGEHSGMDDLITEILSPENLSMLVSIMPNEALMGTMQFAMTELFVRGKTDEDFMHTMTSLVQQAEEVFINTDDKFRDHARKARTEFSVKVENEEFMQGAGAELASILEEHGVVPEITGEGIVLDTSESDDGWPGQYL